MTIDHIKRGGDAVFVAGVPAYFAHVTLADIYTTLGIVWFLARFIDWLCPSCVATVKRWMGH